MSMEHVNGTCELDLAIELVNWNMSIGLVNCTCQSDLSIGLVNWTCQLEHVNGRNLSLGLYEQSLQAREHAAHPHGE